MTDEIHEEAVVYGSDMVDLTGVDLDALSEISGPVLRNAITRVRDELCGDSGESAIYAEFRNSLPDRATPSSMPHRGSEDPNSDQPGR